MGVRPRRRAPMLEGDELILDAVTGIAGDHYAGIQQRKRQVTLIQSEYLAVMSALLGHPVEAQTLRRNLVISGINLVALKGQWLRIGDAAVLEITGVCHPCSRMEESLGAGGFNVMRGHGGMTATIVEGGVIRKGDGVVRIERTGATLELF